MGCCMRCTTEVGVLHGVMYEVYNRGGGGGGLYGVMYEVYNRGGGAV